MYDSDRKSSHGFDRSSPSFADEILAQREIAQKILEEMGITPSTEFADAQPLSLYDGHIEVPRMDALAEALAAEINLAEAVFQRLYPGVTPGS